MRARTDKKRRLEEVKKQGKANKYNDLIESDGGTSDDDDSLQSSSPIDNDAPHSGDDSEEERETAGGKRIRLAREYLSKMEEALQDSDDESSSDGESASTASSDAHDKIGEGLERARLRHHGLLERRLADDASGGVARRWAACGAAAGAEAEAKEWSRLKHARLCRGHELTCTAVALEESGGGATAYSASKDNSVLMWDVERQARVQAVVPRWDRQRSEFTRNSGEALALAAGHEGRYLAVGGRDAAVRIYDVRQKASASLVHAFAGHKGPVTALAFRRGSPQLFSASTDRCIRHYNLQELSYIETLYGHQAPVTAIACHGTTSEMPVSVARDRTSRAWKIAEDTHLIFRGGGRVPSADCVAAFRDDCFFTGHEDGLLALWLTTKKKAVLTHPASHGFANGIARGVASCAVLGETDLALTGSHDGYIRLWKANTGAGSDEKALIPMQKVPIHGYVNDIAIGPNANFCVAAIGQEPRLGRWHRIPRAKNRFAIVQLRNGTNQEDDNHDQVASTTLKKQDNDNS